MRLTIISFLVVLFLAVESVAQVNIIPQPVSVKQPKIAAHFVLSSATQVVLEGSSLEKSAAYLNAYLARFSPIKLKIVKKATGNNVLRLNFERLDNPVPGAYNLTINNKGVYIAGDNEEGVFYGIQTLIQLLPVQDNTTKPPMSIKIPYISIEDAPRFGYRGMHLDVGRHFFPVAFIKKYIDYLALHKLNYFHWHLTEDQGWRIEIKKYPRLTSVGGYRNGTIIGRFPGKGNDGIRYGGFYTQEEVKEIVKYAGDRYITVIPEIELPGHSSAAIAAYPELSCFPGESTRWPKQCAWSGDSTGKQVQQTWGVFDDVYCAGKENTFKFLEDVLAEVMPLFPSSYVHVGGDECPKSNWKRCPNCQQRMKDNNLKDEHELQSYFIQRMEKYLNSKGKTLIGWDEILEGGLAPNAVVMSWRGEKGGIEAAKQKHYVIMTPGNPVYFDHTQSRNEDSVTIGGYNPIEKVYAYEPVPKELSVEEAKYVLGAQANVWTEYMKNTRKVEYMVFPRMSALSEVLWSPKEKRKWEDFEKRLKVQFKRYDLWKINYSKAFFDLKAVVLPTSDYSGVTWSVANKLDKSQTEFYFKRNLSAEDRLPAYDGTGATKIIPYDTSFAKFRPYFSSTSKNPAQAFIKTSAIFRVESHLPDVHDAEATRVRRLSALSLEQEFHFNKATGKKITLNIAPSEKYPGDGAFTLVNGIQNEKGLARGYEFLGFEGTDCEAVIDLGNQTTIGMIAAHVFDQKASWIWYPGSINLMLSNDGTNFTPVKCETVREMNKISCKLQQPVTTRYAKISIQNHGTIPEGNAGAGNKAWLFVDEIEIN
jgi:hexosaminidase